ncbi:hypothetical protein [Desulfoluna spongiiphila]|uniref:Uncharacterized protein n=1 Tax=Desulfoluna spongiiphila TaxID=419481 RepID=A0A1G5HYI8_9BACT|nr:hypothetical protein [Desulfoluna spongiiphila]SCY68863.1 hypothetical protein SAMN05216233_11693 [Desulfoluna spongiiphila]
MHHRHPLRPLTTGILSVSFALLLMGCSSPQKIQSAWQPVDTLRIDGQVDEWEEVRPQYYDEDSRLAVRTMNNADSLFICVTVGSRSMARKVMHSGLTLTLDLDDTQEPDVALEIKPSDLPERNAHEKKDPSRSRNTMASPATIAITIPPSGISMALTPSEARKKGIDARMAQDRFDRLVMEAKLNLKTMALMANTTPETKITLGIESPETSPADRSGDKKSGRKGGRGGRGRSRSVATPLKAELEVTLASPDR